MSFLLAMILSLSSPPAFAESPKQHKLMCMLSYKTKVGTSGSGTIYPSNSDKEVILENEEFCDDAGCSTMLTGNLRYDNAEIKVSVDVAGRMATVFMKPRKGSELTMRVGTDGLKFPGKFLGSLGMSDEYQDQELKGANLSCNISY